MDLSRTNADCSGMESKQPLDVASEPVDLENGDAYMDTGVLHEKRVCTECGDHRAKKGFRLCSDCLEEAK